MKSLVSIGDLSRNDIDTLIKEALEIKHKSPSKIKKVLNEKKIASLFYEPSTRTRTSFETAAVNLGAYVNGFSGTEGSSVKKGESLLDTVRMYAGYGYDAIILRHPLEGSSRYVSEKINIPVINAGDGSNSHPTQTLLDLMTIYELKSTLDGLKIALVGDLKYGRTVHSLLKAFELYNIEPWLISPENLKMPQWRIDDYVRATHRNPIITSDLKTAIHDVDIIYMTRIQRERFPQGIDGQLEYNEVSGIYKITKALLEKTNKGIIIMHPLPRYKHNLEISVDVDNTKNSKYFQQAENGVYMREAIFRRIFSEGFEGRLKDNHNSNLASLWMDLEIKNGSKKGNHMLYRLDNGTLIDHIEAGRGLTVYKILKLDKYQTEVVPALNLNSKTYGKKDVIAINNKFLNPDELYKLALISETATVNIIHNNRVTKKGKVVLPQSLDSLIECPNPNCISHKKNDENTGTRFDIYLRDPLVLRCHYCGTPVTRKNLNIYDSE